MIAVNAVGGITPDMPPQALVIPDQIIDYTWSRDHSFFDEGLEEVVHIDFTHPYCPSLRDDILRAAKQAGVDVVDKATYAAMQGPRLAATRSRIRFRKPPRFIVWNAMVVTSSG